MPEFTKKPVTITAIQYQWDDEAVSMYEAQDQIADFVNTNIAILDEETILLDGVHGQVEVNRGDWVIRQNDQDFYPCSDDVFQQNYNAAPVTWLDRVKTEHAHESKKLSALDKMLSGLKPDNVSDKQWIFMNRQQFHMRMLVQILADRIAEAEGEDVPLMRTPSKHLEPKSGAESFIEQYQIKPEVATAHKITVSDPIMGGSENTAISDLGRPLHRTHAGYAKFDNHMPIKGKV